MTMNGAVARGTERKPLSPRAEYLVVGVKLEKGIGFARPIGSTDHRDHFFHRSSCDPEVFDSLQEGDRIWARFAGDPKGKGPRIADVSRTPQ